MRSLAKPAQEVSWCLIWCCSAALTQFEIRGSQTAKKTSMRAIPLIAFIARPVAHVGPVHTTALIHPPLSNSTLPVVGASLCHCRQYKPQLTLLVLLMLAPLLLLLRTHMCRSGLAVEPSNRVMSLLQGTEVGLKKAGRACAHLCQPLSQSLCFVHMSYGAQYDSCPVHTCKASISTWRHETAWGAQPAGPGLYAPCAVQNNTVQTVHVRCT